MRSQLREKEIRNVNLGPLLLPDYSSVILQKVTSLRNGNIELGNLGLMLNIITPLQKFTKGGITLSDVLKQRYQDLYRREMSAELLKEAEDVYIAKKEVSCFS